MVWAVNISKSRSSSDAGILAWRDAPQDGSAVLLLAQPPMQPELGEYSEQSGSHRQRCNLPLQDAGLAQGVATTDIAILLQPLMFATNR